MQSGAPQLGQRQHQLRGALGVVEERVHGHLPLRFLAERAAGVEIAVGARKVAARHFYSQPMTGLEDLRGGRQLHL